MLRASSRNQLFDRGLRRWVVRGAVADRRLPFRPAARRNVSFTPVAACGAMNGKERSMIGRFVRLSLLMTCVCLLPAMARAQKVGADYDKEVDFSKFTTYA